VYERIAGVELGRPWDGMFRMVSVEVLLRVFECLRVAHCNYILTIFTGIVLALYVSL